MSLLLWIPIGFVAMEAFSWAFHKYVMHGPLWAVHKTHHEPGKGFLEMNDLFSLLFGGLAAAAIYYGLAYGNLVLAGLGMGVTAYGLAYFVLHDIAVHRRFASDTLSRLPWLGRIRKAHKIHHKHLCRKPSRSFGLLFVRKSVFQKEVES